MKLRVFATLLPAALLAGCATQVGPVEVTRFYVPGVTLAQGAIAVAPAAGMPETSLEQRTYQDAVARELGRIGYSAVGPGAAQIAEVRLMRRTWQPHRGGGPVSVGVGGGGGSWGHGGSFGGVGMGVGIDLSPPPAAQVESELAVMIKDRVSGRTLWEGRAQSVVPVTSPLAAPDANAARLAAALFRGFPGMSGETILVR
jgi:hypothetical protein